MGDEQMPLPYPEDESDKKEHTPDIFSVSDSPDLTAQEEVSSIVPNVNSKSEETDSVRKYFESIAPKVIELTTDNFGLYDILDKAMKKSKLTMKYDPLNKVHYKPNTKNFLVRYISQALNERDLPNDQKIVGDIIRNAIGFKLIIKEESSKKTKDGQEFYRLNPHTKKPDNTNEDEARKKFADRIISLSESIQRERVLQINDEITRQDTLTGIEWDN
jgi:hypothetical protein